MTDEEFYALVDQEPQDNAEGIIDLRNSEAGEILPSLEWLNWLETVHKHMPQHLRDRWNGYAHLQADIWLQSVLSREAWEHVQATVPMRAWRSLAYYVRDDYGAYEVGRIDKLQIDFECTLARETGFESPWVCPGPLSIEGRLN